MSYLSSWLIFWRHTYYLRGKRVMFVKKILLLLAIIYFCYSIVYSQSANLKFEHLTVEDGLSGPKVKCIIQDRKGFMWFGTIDGLNKYDGYTFTVYRTDSKDSLTINNTDIRALYEDPSGIIWIATGGGGLNRFDPETEIFTSYGYHTESFYCEYVLKVEGFTYNTGFSLWLGTCAALVKYNLSFLWHFSAKMKNLQ